MIDSPVSGLAGSDLPNASITIATSRSHYRVIEGTSGGIKDGSSVTAGKGNEIDSLVVELAGFEAAPDVLLSGFKVSGRWRK